MMSDGKVMRAMELKSVTEYLDVLMDRIMSASDLAKTNNHSNSHENDEEG